MLANIQLVNKLKAHLESLENELAKTTEAELRVVLLKEKGETIRALKSFSD